MNFWRNFSIFFSTFFNKILIITKNNTRKIIKKSNKNKNLKTSAKIARSAKSCYNHQSIIFRTKPHP
ncbi:hypothetical protein B0181_11380 [Moraxella caviae]|uniref:Uncharacterized protein n=1 Tax=Moraxella caviae TaxID=34060 RepID=A0A1S9ZUF9_9GAMM|nr:hypothetical protein B0181_11380 [Moraxella caviae]STZ10027.1 Uncharacterised protein [Moraxella caviae]VEW13218.1 Uncharacterised protein [Moraxella caviae]